MNVISKGSIGDASAVSMVESDVDVIEAVGRAMEAVSWRTAVPEGADVAIKPNLGFDLLLPGSVTSPLVVEAVVRKLKPWVRKLYLVEADQVVVDSETAFRKTGMDRICSRHGVEWVNLSKSPFKTVKVRDPLAVEELELPEILTRTYLVTIPVMKTHNKTVLSGAIKNQWGCLPTFRHNYHPVVDQVLRDLSTVLRPALTVLDATVALEGNGPKSGRPKICNLILASSDPVAVDTVSAQIMGLGGFPIRHLQLCAEAGIGRHDMKHIRVIDAEGQLRHSLPSFRFTPARHNTVSWIETILRQGFVRKAVFETPILDLMCWGARAWYYVWYYLGGGFRLYRLVAKESPCGWQWESPDLARTSHRKQPS